MSIGKRLRNLRLESRKTLKEQSEIFGVSLNSIYRWEHDLAAPRKTALRKMATHYRVSYEWLKHGNAVCDDPEQGCGDLNYKNDVEQQLLGMYRLLPDAAQYKILGYVERVYIEAMDEKLQPH